MPSTTAAVRFVAVRESVVSGDPSRCGRGDQTRVEHASGASSVLDGFIVSRVNVIGI